MGKPALTLIKGSGCEAILDELKPEHVHDPMARAIMSFARVTPKHLRSPERFLALALAKAAQCGLDITENAARQTHFTLEWASRELDIAVGVIEAEYWQTAELPPSPPAVPFNEARKQLGPQVADMVEAAIAYEPPAPDVSDPIAAPLGVKPQEVVPGQAETADGWLLVEASMGPVPVVAMEPGEQRLAALL